MNEEWMNLSNLDDWVREGASEDDGPAGSLVPSNPKPKVGGPGHGIAMTVPAVKTNLVAA